MVRALERIKQATTDPTRHGVGNYISFLCCCVSKFNLSKSVAFPMDFGAYFRFKGVQARGHY